MLKRIKEEKYEKQGSEASLVRGTDGGDGTDPACRTSSPARTTILNGGFTRRTAKDNIMRIMKTA